MNVPSAAQRLPPVLFSIFLVLLNMFIPLSTDLYLPSLPTMTGEFTASSALVNLSLTIFFIFFAAGTLVWGPVSDKHGRKPVLLLALSIYVVSSLACSLAFSIVMLIAARAVQGFVAGAVVSVSMAVIKDSYHGRQREKALALTQTLGGLAPMIAPVVGAWLLTFTTWRAAFGVLAAIGGTALFLTFWMSETLPAGERHQGSLIQAWGRIRTVVRNHRVLFPVLIFSLASFPFLGYIAASSFIYINQFGLTQQQYSYFFAGNAFLTLLGPILYIRLSPRIKGSLLAALVFSAMALSGLAVGLFGTLSPWAFFASFLLTSLAGAFVRPFSSNLVMGQHAGDSGALASVMGTIGNIFGCLGMTAASIPTENPIGLLALLIVVSAVTALGAWLFLLRSPIHLEGLSRRK